MNEIQKILFNLKYYSENIKVLQQRLIKYLSDTSIPLDERWEVFENMPLQLPTDCCGDGHIDLLVRQDKPHFEYTIYDDFYVERYSTVKFSAMLDTILSLRYPATPESIQEWKEKVLSSGYSAFTHDW